jgi:predicted membrane metal-binding protein
MWPGGYGNRGYGQRSDGLGVVTAEGEHFTLSVLPGAMVSTQSPPRRRFPRAREYRIFLIIFLTLPNLLADPYRGLVAALPIRADQC